MTLNWISAPDPVTYYLIAYGTVSGNYPFGSPNISGKQTTTYTINQLTTGQTYYFVIRAGNGCAPGPSFSNELAVFLPFPILGNLITPTLTPAPLPTPTPTLLPPPSPTPFQNPAINQILGTATYSACDQCFAWPILIAQLIILLIIFRVFSWERKLTAFYQLAPSY